MFVGKSKATTNPLTHDRYEVEENVIDEIWIELIKYIVRINKYLFYEYKDQIFAFDINYSKFVDSGKLITQPPFL